MCFYRTSKCQKAEQDIVCYKMMEFDNNNGLHSSWYHTNVTYYPGSKIKAYKKLSWFKKRNVERINALDHLCGEVVHSVIDYSTAFMHKYSQEVIVKCVIPKGEYYWVNYMHNEYASLSLKIIEIVH